VDRACSLYNSGVEQAVDCLGNNVVAACVKVIELEQPPEQVEGNMASVMRRLVWPFRPW